MIITPAIFEKSFEKVIERVFLLEGLSERVQIDICDGVFGLEKTWLPYEEKELPGGFSYEFDLMVMDWRKYLPRVLALSVDRVVIHIDECTEDDLLEIVSMVSPYKIYLGLSVSNDYSLSQFVHRIRIVEEKYSKVFIQMMGIRRVGAQGQPFDEEVLRRVEQLHETFRHFDIQVDGSMNNETILKVANRGATCAVVGSYLMKQDSTVEDVRKKLEDLRRSFR